MKTIVCRYCKKELSESKGEIAHGCLDCVTFLNGIFPGYHLKIEIDQLPKSLNKKLRANRFKNHRENISWDTIIDFHVRDRLPPEPLKSARLKITRHYFRTLDFDGLVGSLKPVVDGLVSAGVLIDDSWNVLHCWEVYQVFRAKKLGPVLEIEITEG